MPKSIPKPTKSGMKAIEMTLKVWKMTRPSAAATASPAAVVTRMATIIRAERIASHSIRMMAATARMAIGNARSASEPNSSSSIGVEPVSRTLTPLGAVSPRPFASARIASLAAAPGSSWL